MVGETSDGRFIYKPKSFYGITRFLSFKVDMTYFCGNCGASNTRENVSKQNVYVFRCNECDVLNQINGTWERIYISDYDLPD
ncbi:MAG: hypothetical protein QXG00_00600 [Candidatus Woesearchaeota archaeon]